MSAQVKRLDRAGATRELRLELGDAHGLLCEGLEAPAFAGAQQLVDDLDHSDGTPGSAGLRSGVIVAHQQARRRISARRAQVTLAGPRERLSSRPAR